MRISTRTGKPIAMCAGCGYAKKACEKYSDITEVFGIISSLTKGRSGARNTLRHGIGKGDSPMRADYTPEIVARYWAKIHRGHNDECWEWQGALSSGYGHMRIQQNGRSIDLLAHRVSYELHVGEIPQGMQVCHTCDNRRCVNPSHFFIGDHKANAADRDAKGRHRNGDKKGVQNGHAKLNDEQVREIRRRYRPGIRGLASEFGISAEQVRTIAQRKQWRHVED